MRGRLGFILLVIFGSFCVYCAQDVVGGGNGGGGNGGNGGNGGSGNGDGMVGNAGADTCCTPPDPAPYTVLFDQTFTPAVNNGLCVSPPIDVAGNRTLVVHGVDRDAVLFWSFGATAGWVTEGQVAPGNPTPTVVVLDGRRGKQLRFAFGAASGTCPDRALTVVGYKQ